MANACILAADLIGGTLSGHPVRDVRAGHSLSALDTIPTATNQARELEPRATTEAGQTAGDMPQTATEASTSETVSTPRTAVHSHAVEGVHRPAVEGEELQTGTTDESQELRHLAITLTSENAMLEAECEKSKRTIERMAEEHAALVEEDNDALGQLKELHLVEVEALHAMISDLKTQVVDAEGLRALEELHKAELMGMMDASKRTIAQLGNADVNVVDSAGDGNAGDSAGDGNAGDSAGEDNVAESHGNEDGADDCPIGVKKPPLSGVEDHPGGDKDQPQRGIEGYAGGAPDAAQSGVDVSQSGPEDTQAGLEAVPGDADTDWAFLKAMVDQDT